MTAHVHVAGLNQVTVGGAIQTFGDSGVHLFAGYTKFTMMLSDCDMRFISANSDACLLPQAPRA